MRAAEVLAPLETAPGSPAGNWGSRVSNTRRERKKECQFRCQGAVRALPPGCLAWSVPRSHQPLSGAIRHPKVRVRPSSLHL